MAQTGIQLQRHEVVVERAVGFDLVALPHQPQLSVSIAPFQQADQCVPFEVIVFAHCLS